MGDLDLGKTSCPFGVVVGMLLHDKEEPLWWGLLTDIIRHSHQDHCVITVDAAAQIADKAIEALRNRQGLSDIHKMEKLLLKKVGS